MMLPPSRFRYAASFAASVCAMTTAVALFSTSAIPGGLLWLLISGLFALNAYLSSPNR